MTVNHLLNQKNKKEKKTMTIQQERKRKHDLYTGLFDSKSPNTYDTTHGMNG